MSSCFATEKDMGVGVGVGRVQRKQSHKRVCGDEGGCVLSFTPVPFPLQAPHSSRSGPAVEGTVDADVIISSVEKQELLKVPSVHSGENQNKLSIAVNTSLADRKSSSSSSSFIP